MHEFSKNKKSFDSQLAIYKGLREILKTKPLKDVTVMDIKNQCNISRSTFYRNFNNVIDVLDVLVEYFYNRYLENRVNEQNQLLYFFQYWVNHRDLITLINEQCPKILEDCMKRHNPELMDNRYLFDIKYAIFTAILKEWSKNKTNTPEELEQMTRGFINDPAIKILLK